jgi:hypothetical protein
MPYEKYAPHDKLPNRPAIVFYWFVFNPVLSFELP